MSIVSFPSRGQSLQIRGSLGLPNGLGEYWLGWSIVGDDNQHAGIYQSRPRNTGRIFVKMRHYFPRNYKTETQQAWRGVFAEAVAGWQQLSLEQKKEWREKKWPRHMSGYNRYLRYYLFENS